MGMKSQSIACLLSGSDRIYWIRALKSRCTQIWVSWINLDVLEECMDNCFLKSSRAGNVFGRVQKSFLEGYHRVVGGHSPRPVSYQVTPSLKKLLGVL